MLRGKVAMINSMNDQKNCVVYWEEGESVIIFSFHPPSFVGMAKQIEPRGSTYGILKGFRSDLKWV